MPRQPNAHEHVEAAQSCLKEISDARREGDWPKVTALADASNAHLAMAEFAWSLLQAPTGALSAKAVQQWFDAAGVERPR